MAGERELILKLGKKITDRVDVKLGMTKLDANSPEYYGLASVVTDEMAELALAMDVRVPITPEKLAKKVGKRTEEVRALLDQMSGIGLLEYNWENANHEKQYVLPIFVPGCAELMNMHIEQTEEHPEIPKFFDNMAFMPLTKITPMVPPGGSGVGMHVIPVEKAIPAKNESVDVEHLSHWLKKYEGQLGVGYCSCRNAMRIAGDGCGELQDELCIAVGQFAKYCEENNMGRPITYEEAMEILQRAEDNGYVHQITNIDGEDKIFAICNCALGSCFALRTSQLFNTPNMSASARRHQKLRGLRQVRRGMSRRRGEARPEALHQKRTHRVSQAAPARRQPLGRAYVEQELQERQPEKLPRDRYSSVQDGLPGAHRGAGLHQDGGAGPVSGRAEAHQAG